VVTVALPYSALAEPLGLVAIPARVLATLAALTVGYVAANEVIKRHVLIAG
jgi:Mg2+-importing ATPase